MGTRNLQRIRSRHRSGDAVAAERARRWALYGVVAFLLIVLIGFGLMGFGVGVPARAWG